MNIAEVFEVPIDSGAVWHFAASGGWVRPKEHGLTELIGPTGQALNLKDVPGVAVAVREALQAEHCQDRKGMTSTGNRSDVNSCFRPHRGAFTDAIATAATVVGAQEAPRLLDRALT